MSKFIKLPQLAWHGVSDLELSLREEWQVEVCNMRGYNRRGLTTGEIREAIRNPTGMPPIRECARNKKQVVIIFDDIQRATRVAQIVPFVLEELAEAGIRDNQVQFIAATACHAAMNRFDFVKKLGEEVLHRFPVYSHNVFGNCVDAGTTSYGTRILANAEVMASDFKIAIGSVVPHAFAGFGGGAKIILPGVCHYQTCLDFHRSGSRYAQKHKNKPVGIGVLEGNLLRLDMEEAAEMVGLDIKIDTLMNSYGETVAIYAGTLKAAYPLAVKDAQEHYDTVLARDADIIIANAFAKVAECESGLEMAFPSVRKESGDVVLIGNAPEGHVEHYLASPWGKNTRESFQMRCSLADNVNRLIVYTQYPDLTLYGYFSQPEKVTILSNWDEALALLKKSHPGFARVAVYPNADIQYCSTASGSNVLSFLSGD
jgi:nickel-dependent lactate racemase